MNVLILAAVLVIASRYIFYAHVETAYHTKYLLLGPIDNDHFFLFICHERFNLPGFSVPRYTSTYHILREPAAVQYDYGHAALVPCVYTTSPCIVLRTSTIAFVIPTTKQWSMLQNIVVIFCLGSLNPLYRPEKVRKAGIQRGAIFLEIIWDGHEHQTHKAAPCCWGRG